VRGAKTFPGIVSAEAVVRRYILISKWPSAYRSGMSIMWREAMKLPRGPKSIVDNVNETGGRSAGNSKSYTLSRLERDHRELFERVCNGDIELPEVPKGTNTQR
jgi:hypothetical protein